MEREGVPSEGRRIAVIWVPCCFYFDSIQFGRCGWKVEWFMYEPRMGALVVHVSGEGFESVGECDVVPQYVWDGSKLRCVEVKPGWREVLRGELDRIREEWEGSWRRSFGNVDAPI